MREFNPSSKDFKALIATPDWPALGPAPRVGRLPLLEVSQKIDRFLAESNLPAAIHPSIRSAGLLWHDYLDESHTISQNLPGADGSFLHGIMHRREPDYPNAKYWFHRVGKHPSFPDLARQVTGLLDSKGETKLAAKLAPGGDWNPIAFIDVCQEPSQWALSDARIQALQAIQEIEFDCLLARLLAG